MQKNSSQDEQEKILPQRREGNWSSVRQSFRYEKKINTQEELKQFAYDYFQKPVSRYNLFGRMKAYLKHSLVLKGQRIGYIWVTVGVIVVVPLVNIIELIIGQFQINLDDQSVSLRVFLRILLSFLSVIYSFLLMNQYFFILKMLKCKQEVLGSLYYDYENYFQGFIIYHCFWQSLQIAFLTNFLSLFYSLAFGEYFFSINENNSWYWILKDGFILLEILNQNISKTNFINNDSCAL